MHSSRSAFVPVGIALAMLMQAGAVWAQTPLVEFDTTRFEPAVSAQAKKEEGGGSGPEEMHFSATPLPVGAFSIGADSRLAPDEPAVGGRAQIGATATSSESGFSADFDIVLDIPATHSGDIQSARARLASVDRPHTGHWRFRVTAPATLTFSTQPNPNTDPAAVWISIHDVTGLQTLIRTARCEPDPCEVDLQPDNLYAFHATTSLSQPLLDPTGRHAELKITLAIQERVVEIDLGGLIEGLSADPPIVIDAAISTDPATGDMSGPNRNANAGRLGAFVNRLRTAQELLSTGDVTGACEELNSAEQKLSGDRAWFEGDAAGMLQAAVNEIQSQIGCP